jgi:hypothetical protein
MNKRIKELAKQVWPDPNTSHDNHMKFAELIVRECADIGERYADGNYEVRNQIMAHFGLEEA